MASHEDGAGRKVPELLFRFVRAIYELNRCEPRHGGGLSSQQLRALLFLVHRGEGTVKELAGALSISEARASRLADELATIGAVLHQRDTVDRRVVRLQVAPAAAETARRIYRERSGAVRAALAGVPPEEVEVFTRLLGRVVEEFEDLAHRAALDEEPSPLEELAKRLSIPGSPPAVGDAVAPGKTGSG